MRRKMVNISPRKRRKRVEIFSAPMEEKKKNSKRKAKLKKKKGEDIALHS